MLKLFVFIVKAALFVAAAVWVAGLDGTLHVTWHEYTIRAGLGPALLFLMLALLALVFCDRVLAFFVGLSGRYRAHRAMARRDAAQRTVTRGLAAVAAGDAKAAARLARRARKFLPREQGLVLLLEAQTARLEGRSKDATRIFTQLSHDKDAGFLGLRGLLQAALEQNDYAGALATVRESLARHPRLPWLWDLRYDLETKQQLWARAQQSLKQRQKLKSLDAGAAPRDRAALFCALGDEADRQGQRSTRNSLYAQAQNISPGFTPAATRLARALIDEGRDDKARGVILKAWKTAPHPDFAALWQGLQPVARHPKPLERLRWSEKLAAQNPAHPDSLLLMARATTDEHLWGEARENLRRAEAAAGESADAGLYALWESMERKAGAGDAILDALRRRESLAPPAPRWVCTQSGRIFAHWQPQAVPGGTFNTIVWQPPGRAPAVEFSHTQALPAAAYI